MSGSLLRFVRGACVVVMCASAIAVLNATDSAPVTLITPTTMQRLVYWNDVAMDVMALDHTPPTAGDPRVFGEQFGPTRTSRAMAIMHIAMHDALNAIYPKYKTLTRVPAADPASSIDAALAQSASDTLVALYPSQSAAVRAKLVADLATIPLAGRAAGIATGAAAARAILRVRADDGSNRPEPVVGVDFFPSDAPGKWRPDPVSQIPYAIGAHWGKVRPFMLRSGSQFRLPPPPRLNSAEYAAAFAQVKDLGGDGLITPTRRSTEQTEIGIFWAYDGTTNLCAPPRMYNQIAMTIAEQRGTDVPGVVRLLALVNIAMADAAIAAWDSKYYYQFWRPVTGIREADPGTGPTGLGDGNARTQGDPTFTPLGSPASNLSGVDFTPPFPAYPSGHAVIGASLFEVLTQFYGTTDIPFTFTSDEYNGQTTDSTGTPRPLLPRSFSTLTDAMQENALSRIYLGVHWKFDSAAGITQGRRVAQEVLRSEDRLVR